MPGDAGHRLSPRRVCAHRAELRGRGDRLRLQHHRDVRAWRSSAGGRSVGKLVYAASSTKFAIEGDGRHQNPYSFTKATNVDLLNDYGRWYELPYAICYFYNAFGPREVGDGPYATLIARFAAMHRRGRAADGRCAGDAAARFTYVKDLARGIKLVGERGQGDGYALRADQLATVSSRSPRPLAGRIEIVDGYSGRDDVADDPRRARDELGWEADGRRSGLHRGVSRAIA